MQLAMHHNHRKQNHCRYEESTQMKLYKMTGSSFLFQNSFLISSYTSDYIWDLKTNHNSYKFYNRYSDKAYLIQQ